ncbi:hypothetical protein OH77DRAFT_1498274 [Trametes cingulata]|nr:hypothetical protein OH77DRAFT_1498274 [Trametes cingulata]
MNHFLALVVDELLDLWDPGVYYTKTATSPHGRLVRAALIPLVADLLAARQLSGLGPHNHRQVLCSVCTTSADNVENVDPSTFVPRDLVQHRAHAQEWLEAQTTLERELLFERTGVRYSELLRLDYWNPLLYTVIDTMHNLYLGVLQRHIRTIWGINVDVEDGDASGIDSGSAPTRPSEDKMAAGVQILLNGSEAELRRAGKATLYHLCVDRGIRRAGTVSQLVKNLVAWVSVHSALMPDYGDTELTQELASAERTLRGPKASTAMVRRKKDTLMTMCGVRGLDREGSKEVLTKRLLDWTRYAPEADSHRHSQEAIGKDTLRAYMEDRSRMELPSWVNAPPLAFGTKQHGKLSADQWRSLCVINLPVTLIRTWSFQEKRRVKMLENFLEVVEAVETFGLLEIDDDQIARAEQLMQRYLEGVKELYKGAKIQPNHHLALHIGVFLRLFGPVHSWRSFVFERFNYYLQTLNTNMTFGELEMTFMMHSCRAANFRPLLRSPPVQRYMQDFSKSLAAADKHDRRGMRFDAILRSSTAIVATSPEGDPLQGPAPTTLEPHVYQGLLQRLSFDRGDLYSDEREYYLRHPPDRLPLPRQAIRCASVVVSGVHYKPWHRSPGDSNVMFRHPAAGDGSHPGRIEQIFIHNRREPGGSAELRETFLVVKRLKPLTPRDASLDPYRRYPGVGGCLYYEAYDDSVLVLSTGDLTSHFALTRMDHLVVQAQDAQESPSTGSCQLSKPCVHVRPLDRLLREAKLNPGENPDPTTSTS